MRFASSSEAAIAPGDSSRSEVERRGGGTEVEADRPGLPEPVERRRQDVLARVLLHVIKAAFAIHDATDRAAG